ncbi:MAG: ABC transporter substrate-binding protein [Vicinamibacterales bacterium]
MPSPRLLAVLAVVAGAAACGSDTSGLTHVTFLTNYVFIGRHAPFFVGVDQGFYQEAGFDVEVVPATGSALVVSSLEGGQADFGIAEAASVVQAVGRGARVQAFGVYLDRSTSGLASLSPYPSPSALSGARVAASLTDSARVVLPIVLAGAGIPPSSVNWLAADPSTYFSLLLTNQADLITASSDSDVPALKRVADPQGRQVHFASFADWGYDVYGYFLVTRADRIATAPDQVRAFAAATTRAVRYAAEHPEEAARAVARRSPALDETSALAQWRASLDALQTAEVAARGYGTATTDRLQRTIDLVKAGVGLDTVPTPARLFADGFMPR